jgi:hypothetical protein
MHGWASSDFFYAWGSIRALLSGEAGFRAVGRMATSEPSSAGRRGPEPWGTWQRRSPPQREGRVWSHRTRGSAGALLRGEVGVWSHGTHDSTGTFLSREARSKALEHVAACGSSPYSLSWLKACIQGYSVCRVPTVALRPTSGEVANLQVGPTHHHPAQLF